MRLAGLKAIQVLIEQKGKLLAPCATRRLSVERSVNRLKSCFSSVVISLQREGEEKGDTRALGLQAMMCEYRFVCTMLLMCDALPHVTHMSKCFQTTDCDFSIIPAILETTLTSLHLLKTRGGVNLRQLDSFLRELEQAEVIIKKPANMADDYFLNSIRTPFLTRLIKKYRQPIC